MHVNVPDLDKLEKAILKGSKIFFTTLMTGGSYKLTKYLENKVDYLIIDEAC